MQVSEQSYLLDDEHVTRTIDLLSRRLVLRKNAATSAWQLSLVRAVSPDLFEAA
jgi:hypothetical protein